MSYFSSYFTNLSVSSLSQVLEKLSRTCLVIPVPRTSRPMKEELEYTGDVTDLLYAVCVFRRHVLLIGFDELSEGQKGDWLADEEGYQNEAPLYFSESWHRTSPVYLMKLLRSSLATLSEEKYETSILLVCNYPIINVEDMQEEWEEEDVWVVPSCPSIEGLKTGLMDQLKDENLWGALLSLYERSIPDLLKSVHQEKKNVTEDIISETEDAMWKNDSEEETDFEDEDEFEKLLNDFIASELEEEDSENSLAREQKKAAIPIKGSWRETVDKESDLYQSLEQLDWEVAYGIPKTKLAWRKSGMLEWVAWPEAKLWIRVTTALERDAVLFDYLEGAEVYFVDHEKYVVREEKIRRCDIWKDQWAKICLETLPLQKESSLGEWTNGEILIVKDEVELVVLPLRWMYLPAIPDVLRFRDVRLYRNVSSVLEASDSTTALSCFARKGLRNVLAVYRAENVWGKEFPAMFRCRLYGDVGNLLAEKYVTASFHADSKEVMTSIQWGKADGITWKKARYMIEVRFREEVAFFAFFEVGKNDVSGVCRKDETTPAEGDTSDSTSGTETEMSSWEELQELHGMDEFRQRMEELAAYRRYMDQRENMGFQTPLPPLHMAFMGNSTTKKQKVVNLLGKLLCDLKFLNNGKVTYVDWEEFVQKNARSKSFTNEEVSLADNVRAAQGGILFLDRVSPPSVWDDNNAPRNIEKEVWTDLASRLHKDGQKNWVLVLSGNESMIEETINQFDELSENIPPQNRFHFADYTHDELMEVAFSYCRQHHYRLSEDAVEALRNKIQEEFIWTAGTCNNSEFIENLFTNEILETMALRVSKLKFPTATDLMTIRKEDIPTTPKESGNDMQKLKKMVGLSKLKANIENHLNMVRMMKWRMDKGLEASMPPLHMIFVGNPGTGKTTVADFIGEIYASMGLLSKGKVIKVSRNDLVGQYLGHTEKKTQEYLKRAEGNVLFIDEAYSLCADENGKDFGHRVIEILLTVLDKDQVDMLVILAGYPEEMKKMIETNPGLPSRFPYTFYFNDYSVDELMQIARNYVENKHYFFTPKAFQALRTLVERQYEDKDRYWGNARFIVRLISSQILPAMGSRLAALTVEKRENKRTLQQICLADVQACDTVNQVEPFEEEEIERALRKLDAMVGLAKVKESVHNFVTVARYLQKRGQSYFRDEPLRWSFVGNTGTGKSTVAGILAEILRAMHVLNRGNLIELKAENLYNVPDYKVDELIRNAMKQSEQGLLFVDGDAPMFKNPQTRFNGQELRFKLNSLMMELPGNYAVVIAEQTPYGRVSMNNEIPTVLPEMDHTFYFEDYSPEELMDILSMCLEKRNLHLEPEAVGIMETYISHLHDNKQLGYANARTMNALARDILNHYLVRISRNRSAFDGKVIKEDVDWYVWVDMSMRKKIGFRQ